MANTPYYLPASSAVVGDAGSKYHIVCTATLPSQAGGGAGPNTAGPVTYGFMLKPTAQSPYPFQMRTDVTTKQDLIQYASTNLIDRDLVFYPRISDGDFSGGMLQTTFVNEQRFWASDLSITLPGYLQLNPAWVELSALTGVGSVSSTFACAADAYIVVANSGGKIASVNAAGSFSASFASPVAIASDQQYAYICSGSAVSQYAPTTGTLTSVSTTLNGTLTGAWVVNEGTNGFFLFYSSADNLYKIDLTGVIHAFPVPAASQPQVALGSTNQAVLDVCGYQTGVAIMTGSASGIYNGGKVWYNDNSNTTLIADFPGYHLFGMVNCLGNLYVTGMAPGGGPALLFQIDSGVVSTVVKFGLPVGFSNSSISGPCATADAVYWDMITSPINGIATNYTVRYDVVTGAVSQLPVNVGSWTNPTRPFVWGDSVAYGYGTAAASGTLFAQVQATAGTTFTATQTYATSGWMISSKLDANTPTIAKQFHEVKVTHAPLPAGSSLKVNAYADQDPTTILVASTVPTVTTTNSTLNSTTTTLAFAGQIVAKSIVVAMQLTAGTSQLTTPAIYWFSVEISTPWAFELYFDCTESRRTITQEVDQQGVQAADLTWFWANAQENPGPITVYIPDPNPANSRSYVCEAETVEIQSPGLHLTQNAQDNSNWESFVHVVLRQSA